MRARVAQSEDISAVTCTRYQVPGSDFSPRPAQDVFLTTVEICSEENIVLLQSTPKSNRPPVNGFRNNGPIY